MKFISVLFVRTEIHILPMKMHLSLVKKSWSSAHEMNVHDLTSILHTATEFRSAVNNHKAKIIKLPDLRCKSVTLLLRKSNELLEASFYSAGLFLMVPTHTIVRPNWDKRDHVLDIRKVFERHTDCLFCESQYVSKSHNIIYNSPIPVVFVRCCGYMIILGLAQLMTIYLRFGCLSGLNILWIGPPCAILNTLLAFCPKLFMNLKYCCGFNASAPASPSGLANIIQQCALDSQSFNCKECGIENITDIVKNADVIITTKQQGSSLKITKDMMKTAKSQCIILHSLQRGMADIEEELFLRENCLVWEMVTNMKWIFAALMVRLLSEYEHLSQEPMFVDQSRNNCNNNSTIKIK